MKRLAELKALSPFLNVSALARYLGMSRNGLHIRLERGSPELTTVESEKLSALFYMSASASVVVSFVMCPKREH